MHLGPEYQLVRRISGGSRFEVWEAREVSSHKRLVAKLHYALVGDVGLKDFEDLERQWTSESVALSQLNSDFVIRDHDSIEIEVEDGDARYLVSGRLFDYPRLGRLEEYVATSAWRLSTTVERLNLLRDLAVGLGQIHAAGIVHNDINPSAIVVNGAPHSPIPQYSDFGVRRLKKSPQRLPAGGVFVAPELKRSEGFATQSSDIYALGVVYLWLLAGDMVQSRQYAHRSAQGLRPSPDWHREAFAFPGGEEVSALIEMMTDDDRNSRPIAEEIVELFDVILSRIKADQKPSRPSLAQEPAAIRPVWRGEVLAMDEAPTDGRFAFSALGAILETLAAALSQNSNTDPRIAAQIWEIIGRIPPGQPEIHQLFRLGHDQEVLAALLSGLRDELPPTQLASFEAAVAHFDQTLLQFADWAAFKRNVAAAGVTLDQQMLAEPLLATVAHAIRTADQDNVVDEEVVAAMDALLATASPTPSTTLALDQIESANNTLKVIASDVLVEGREPPSSKKRAFVDRFLLHLDKALEAEAETWATHVVQAPRKVAKLAVKSVAAVGGGYAGLLSLSHYFPQFMNWVIELGKFLR